MVAIIPAPIAFCMCGAMAGFIGGGFNQGLPILIGAATGMTLGCCMSVYACFSPNNVVLPIALPVSPEPVIVQNIFITYNVTGQSKEPVLPKVEPGVKQVLPYD